MLYFRLFKLLFSSACRGCYPIEHLREMDGGILRNNILEQRPAVFRLLFNQQGE